MLQINRWSLHQAENNRVTVFSCAICGPHVCSCIHGPFQEEAQLTCLDGSCRAAGDQEERSQNGTQSSAGVHDVPGAESARPGARLYTAHSHITAAKGQNAHSRTAHVGLRRMLCVHLL